MAHKIYLALLWHQHQPYYKDLKSGQAIMPWVRLHATKDYYDMVALLDDFPKIRMTVNLVPSLLLQLQDFAQNRCTDPWLEKSLIPASQLTEQDKCWILENFFFCNWDTMIFPNPRYAELFEKRGKFASREEMKRTQSYFSVQDFLDLQVWFNLAWMDPIWQEKDPLVSHLYKKGKKFSEEEKSSLIEKQREICRLAIEKHKELWHKNQIELSTTPFYHPILPLICDTDAAQMAMPGSPKPKRRFQHPEDAKAQVEKAIRFMENLFGKRPIGMWPSEGSVSKQALSILAEAGIKWAATDEKILFHSLERDGLETQRHLLYQPYWAEAETLPPATEKKSKDEISGTNPGRLQMVFRDHALSDAIGFVYARMDPKKAVEDFVNRILKIADAVPESDSPPLVPVILDGENCWESYARDGNDFLKILYGTLSQQSRIETTTIGGFIEKYPAKKTLKKLWAGSWINSDFAIWIGHHEDNRAWDLLSETREFLAETLKKYPEKAADPSLQMAWESLYIAEGSDWCWWYGDQNSTAQDEIFDELFRSHLKNVYRFAGKEPPQKLSTAIKGKARKGEHILPVEFISPKIDGLVTNYYEWRTGGIVQAAPTGGAMHQAETFLIQVCYGFDLENLYIRLDTKEALKKLDLSEIKIALHFIEPSGHELQIHWENQTVKAHWSNRDNKLTSLKEVAANKIIELALPFSFLPVKENDPIEFVVLVIKQGIQIERWPYQSSIHLKRPTKEFGSDLWSA